jgi:hypothetical protein
MRSHLNQWWCSDMYLSSQLCGKHNRRIASRTAIKWEPTLEKANMKRAGKVTQMVQHLPSKHKALSSVPNTTKKKKKLNSLVDRQEWGVAGCWYQSLHSPSCKWRTVFAPVTFLLLGHQGKCSPSVLGGNGYSVIWSSLRLVMGNNPAQAVWNSHG